MLISAFEAILPLTFFIALFFPVLAALCNTSYCIMYKGAKLASAMALVDFLHRPVSVQGPNPPRNTLKFPAPFGTDDLE